MVLLSVREIAHALPLVKRLELHDLVEDIFPSDELEDVDSS